MSGMFRSLNITKMRGFYRACFIQRSSYIQGRNLFTSYQRASASENKNKDTIRPRRAIMYVPGHDRKKINKLSTLDVDCAVLDCEDGVAVNKKEEARKMIAEVADSFDFGKTEFAVRINSIDSELAEEDLKAVLSCKNIPETLMIPKIEDSDHVYWIVDKLKTSFKSTENRQKLNLIFFIESAKSLLNMRDICKTAMEISNGSLFRFEGVVFGSDDFCADIGATRSESGYELLTARQLFVITAKSFKIQAIDMVHINYKDLSSLMKNCEDGARLGFTGKQVIHPTQIPIVQKAFSPSTEKIEWAKELIRLFNEHQSKGTGAFTFQGSMIDKPLLRQAEYIVKLSKLLT